MEGTSNRMAIYKYFSGEHKTIDSLRVEKNLPCERYIGNSIHFTHLARVEFHVSKIAHVTIKSGLDGILSSEGFQGVNDNLLWFGMVIEDEDIQMAEERYLEKTFPGRSDGQKEMQKPFLAGLTTSPAFEMGTSRYGNFKFTFGLQDMLQLYKEQICGGEKPVMRVYGTFVYKQEIMYAVIVHSPSVEFKQYPVLRQDDAVCTFKNQSIIWQAQALANMVKCQPVTNQKGIIELAEGPGVYYVWDHVTLAFHVPNGQTLKLSKERLIQNLSACEADKGVFIGGKCGSMNCICGCCRLPLPEAQNIVEQFKNKGQEQAG